MIETVGIEELKRRIRIEHDKWVDAGVHAEARRLLAKLSPRLEQALALYVLKGIKSEVKVRNVSTSALMTRPGFTYLNALETLSDSLVGGMW